MINEFVRFDWAIKHLLRDKANYVVVEGLLTVLLERKIHITKILESEGNQEYYIDKFNRVDLLAEDDDGELMLFEIQNNRELAYFHRMAYGTAKAITEYINISEDYSNIRKVYSINIIYFDLGQGSDYVYRGRTVFRGLHEPHDELRLSERQRKVFRSETPADIMPEYYVLRVDEFDKVATTPLDEWIRFLKTGEIDEGTQTPGLPEARERLRVALLPEKERRQYLRDMEDLMYQRSIISTERIEGREEGRVEGIKVGMKEGIKEGMKVGRAEGIKEGREEGLKEGIKAVALNMKQMGIPVASISQATGLTIDELTKLLP